MVKVRDRFRARLENGLFALSGVDPDNSSGVKKKAARRELFVNAAHLGDLQGRLYAERTRSLLIVLQAMDTGGKDGTIKHAMSGFNPQGVRVTGFKQPTPEEKRHPYLWRIRNALPGPGEVAIFNRSHYEDVIVPRVKGTLKAAALERRYDQLNAFEAELHATGTHVVKLCLHISYDEQRRRLLRRLHDPTRRWKFNPTDIADRGHWDEYQAAYDAAIAHTSTKDAPWYVLPANHKWYRNWAVSHILMETLEEIKPRYPEVKLDIRRLARLLQPQP